jgi:hypothetical protein
VAPLLQLTNASLGITVAAGLREMISFPARLEPFQTLKILRYLHNARPVLLDITATKGLQSLDPVQPGRTPAQEPIQHLNVIGAAEEISAQLRVLAKYLAEWVITLWINGLHVAYVPLEPIAVRLPLTTHL